MWYSFALGSGLPEIIVISPGPLLACVTTLQPSTLCSIFRRFSHEAWYQIHFLNYHFELHGGDDDDDDDDDNDDDDDKDDGVCDESCRSLWERCLTNVSQFDSMAHGVDNLSRHTWCIHALTTIRGRRVDHLVPKGRNWVNQAGCPYQLHRIRL